MKTPPSSTTSAKNTTGAKRPRSARESPEVRRKSLVEATMRSIAKHGYAGTTIDKICEEAQISRGLINHHFENKEGLLVHCYKDLCDEWTRHTQSVRLDSFRDPEDELSAAVHLSFSPLLFKKDYISIWIGFWSVIDKSAALKKLNRALYDEECQRFAGILETINKKRGIAIDIRLLTISLLAMIDGLWLQWSLNPKGFSIEEAEHACLQLIQQAIDGAPRAGRPAKVS